MGKAERLNFIRQIEESTDSNVISYIVGDRPGLAFQIAGDVVRKIYEHLLLLSKLPSRRKNISLFLYSRGGHGDVPWQIVPMVREFCNEFYVLVPYRAHSAATLIALGADKIIMGRKGELGPVDPSIQSHFHPVDPYKEKPQPLGIGVEDISSYLTLIKDKLKLTEQEQITKVFNILAEKVGPLALGNLNRFYSHTRLLIEKLLKTHKCIPSKRKIRHIVNNLTEKIFFHGHVIARKEAQQDMDLDIELPNSDLEEKIWSLYTEYENDLRLADPFEPDSILIQRNAEETREDNIIAAYIESQVRTDVCTIDFSLRRQRQMPGTLNLNINVQLPPGVDPAQMPPGLIQQVQQGIQQIVNAEIRRQAPIIGITSQKVGGGWRVEN